MVEMIETRTEKLLEAMIYVGIIRDELLVISTRLQTSNEKYTNENLDQLVHALHTVQGILIKWTYCSGDECE